MILLAEKSMTLNGAIDQVFSYVTNMENYSDWFPGVLSINSFNQLPHGVKGKKYQEVLTLPDAEVKLVIEVKDSKINRRFYTEGDLDPIFPAMLMEFNSTPSNTTEFSLKYYSRNSTINTEEAMINALKQDLSQRIKVAEDNLLVRF